MIMADAHKSKDPREIDIVFTLIRYLLDTNSFTLHLGQAFQKYSVLIFSPNLLDFDCSLFADYILEIYCKLRFEQLSAD